MALRTLLPRRELAVDAVLVQPALEWLTLRDGSSAQVLLRSFDLRTRRREVVVDGADGLVATTYDSQGRVVSTTRSDGDEIDATVVPGGFTVVRSESSGP